MKKTGQVKPHKLVRVLPLSLLISDAGDFYLCPARLQGEKNSINNFHGSYQSVASCFDGPFISMTGIQTYDRGIFSEITLYP